ncbi:primosomal replication protein N [Candidatus Palibaumannia cicadellinicola]|uniref:Replication restart protein PriB n=1 Tax=Candidatus Palibaumannia cicadellinicola TaxID=186490 RepID=A0A0K2BLA4_9GAMM|nr:primosomal replication protein N [Candidatus Baumannia cicadellinicola]AKZ66100.1 Primosomal replication protein N [Candidatus Baumannia cicadellinicola]
MKANHLMLSGTVCKTPISKVSPSGIKHYQFVIEHRSVQNEAGFIRQAWCRVPVVVSSSILSNNITNNITVGDKITVHGFICSHKGRNGLRKIVLHAEHIYLID